MAVVPRWQWSVRQNSRVHIRCCHRTPRRDRGSCRCFWSWTWIRARRNGRGEQCAARWLVLSAVHGLIVKERCKRRTVAERAGPRQRLGRCCVALRLWIAARVLVVDVFVVRCEVPAATGMDLDAVIGGRHVDCGPGDGGNGRRCACGPACANGASIVGGVYVPLCVRIGHGMQSE